MPPCSAPFTAGSAYWEKTTTSVRLVACSFRMLCEMCDLTVFCDSFNSLAMTLFDRARRRISYHKLPGWIVFVDEIPVTWTQKMRKGLIFPESMDPRTHPQATDLRHLKKRIVAASQPAG